eukprot:CAMPEP_0113955182 /NCGR_PEP_ID=MMETSP0011_2-20120614/1120_1 /TAXON_ID=101924 /ORGANISM="Rhodosorus marinus" /LENGTH=91 /DNA_ID=CAMNT_0000964701 /DNA_START=1013 /DNA_END=1288 /DNA_ORIENTATION=+ /assembly_acc=CAM_ASM_000156
MTLRVQYHFAQFVNESPLAEIAPSANFCNFHECYQAGTNLARKKGHGFSLLKIGQEPNSLETLELAIDVSIHPGKTSEESPSGTQREFSPL